MNKKVIIIIVIAIAIIIGIIGTIFALNYFGEKNKEYKLEKIELSDCKYFALYVDRKIWSNK